MLQPPQPGSQDVTRLGSRFGPGVSRSGTGTCSPPWPAGPTDERRDQVIYYQYKADRARRTLLGIDEQIAKAENAVAGKVPVKRNRFIVITGADKSVNRVLEAKPATWPGSRVTPPTSPTRHRSS
jgi:hypothetical protein